MSKPETPREHQVQGNGVALNVLELGASNQPTVVMVHGLRDSARALIPVAQHLTQATDEHAGFRVLISELRGHGRSETSHAYAMPDFLLDLHAINNALVDDSYALFGHSLGGHIVSKYAALFPEQIKALLVIEGTGPPKRPHEGDEAAEVQAYAQMLLARAAIRPSTSKPIADVEDVVTRLCRNNPRLTPEHAQNFAPYLVKNTADGLRWAFDPRANSVFLGSSRDTDARFWRQVSAPTCLVSGTLSYEYWGREMAAAGFSGQFAEGEMEARAANFQHHEHHWFDKSGHMVHYDEPDRLGQLSRSFLERHYV